MASGVKVNNDCKTTYLDLKKNRKFRYLLFGFTEDDKTEITVLKEADPNATYDEFVQDLFDAETKKECRYAVYDAEYEAATGMKKNKILFFMWSPDTATVKQKMLYASSKDALRKTFGEGLAKEIQACDHGELLWSNVLDICKKQDHD